MAKYPRICHTTGSTRTEFSLLLGECIYKGGSLGSVVLTTVDHLNPHASYEFWPQPLRAGRVWFKKTKTARMLSYGSRCEPFVLFKRRAWESNPQPVSRHLISSEAASHSLTLRKILPRLPYHINRLPELR